MLSIKMRVACSALSIRTLSASASAFWASASARTASAEALRTVLRSWLMATMALTSPPPRTTFSISLQDNIVSVISDYTTRSS